MSLPRTALGMAFFAGLALLAVAMLADGQVGASGPTVSSTTTPSPTITPPPTPTPPPSVSQEEVDANRSKWEAAGIDSYRYDVTFACFCFFEHGPTATVVVLNGESDSVTWSDGTAIVDFESEPFVDEYTTIDDVFEAIESRLGEAYLVEASFDDEFGYPRDAFFDNAPLVADDELGVAVTNFAVIDPVVLPPTGGHP